MYVNPGILFLLYMTIVTVLKTGFHATPNQVSSSFSLVSSDCSSSRDTDCVEGTWTTNKFFCVVTLEFTGTCSQVDREQQLQDNVPSSEETVELRMWNQTSDASEDDTEVSTLEPISFINTYNIKVVTTFSSVVSRRLRVDLLSSLSSCFCQWDQRAGETTLRPSKVSQS